MRKEKTCFAIYTKWKVIPCPNTLGYPKVMFESFQLKKYYAIIYMDFPFPRTIVLLLREEANDHTSDRIFIVKRYLMFSNWFYLTLYLVIDH